MDTHMPAGAMLPSVASSLPASFAPLDVRLNRIDHTKNEIRKLTEQWQRIPTLEYGLFGKEYIETRLSVVCDFHLRGFWEAHRAEELGLPRVSVNCIRAVLSRAGIGAGSPSADSPEGLHGADQYWHPVLVDVVELAERPQRKIPSLIGFYLVNDQIVDIGGGIPYLFRCFIEGIYQFKPRLVHWESQLFILFVASDSDSNFHPKMVQGSSEIMDCVSSNKGQGDYVNRLGNLKLQDIIDGVRFSIQPDTVTVEISSLLLKSGLELKNVMIGPSYF